MHVAEVIIPQMFTAYAEDLGYLQNGLHQYQYFCEECDQAFTSAWGRKTGAMGWYERGNYFYCPHCGTRHEENVAAIKRGVQAPNKVRLSVKAYKNVVNFEVVSRSVDFRDLASVYEGRFKECFRFDLAKQTVSFTRYHNGQELESMEIGNPFKLDVFEKSILRFFQPYSLANSRQKAELNNQLKVLRECVHSKLEQRLGYKVPSLYVSPGQYYGTFLLQIFNMAYRLKFPDAPNLPIAYRESPDRIERFWKMKVISDHGYMDEVMALSKGKNDFVTTMATVNSLPDTPFIRRVLSQDPFDAPLLSKAFAICQNYDFAVRLYNGFKSLEVNERYTHVNDELLQFLKTMLPFYGEAGISYMVENAKELELWDCVRLYRQLSDENRQALKTEHVKLKNLHDWMALKHLKQSHKNLKFDVPDHIVRRLSMQTDRLKFFMPKETIQLLEAGTQLHNCVASYGKDMKNNSKWIVLVADDKGKLTACLEVRGRDLVQAKIDRNKPVSDNPKLNSEVLAWTTKAKIKIKTSDVKVHTEESRMAV